MFQEILTENGTKFIVAAVVVLLGLLCLALVLWIVRGRPSSPFIRGGRNRLPRLAVLDAAAIDTRRRLVLVRRDDVEHLIMIGGPTDVVIESRIVSTPAESAPQPVEQKAHKAESVQQPAQETVARPVETPVAARSAAVATASAAERRPANQPDGVSAMGKVLYAADEETAARPVPVRPVSQPATAHQVQAAAQQRTPERRVEDLLEQNRQRVLTPQVAATTTAAQGQAVQRPVTAANAKPAEKTADNPALVSEFEKILEAEMTSNAALAAPARAAVQPVVTSAQGFGAAGQGQQPPAKSREETEAEMARLLGEIAANRKS